MEITSPHVSSQDGERKMVNFLCLYHLMTIISNKNADSWSGSPATVDIRHEKMSCEPKQLSAAYSFLHDESHPLRRR